MQRKHWSNMGALFVVAALSGGCAAAAQVSEEVSRADEQPVNPWRKDELRTACASKNDGNRCWELATWLSREGDDVRASIYAKKACVLGVGAACHQVAEQTGATYETLLAEKMAREMPLGLNDWERCQYWTRQEQQTNPRLEKLRTWVGYAKEGACGPIEQMALEKVEAEYERTERMMQEAAAQLDARKARARPCKWWCISASAAGRQSCRRQGEFKVGPCHDRSQAETDQCLAMCHSLH